jgi:hypothetical protein
MKTRATLVLLALLVTTSSVTARSLVASRNYLWVGGTSATYVNGTELWQGANQVIYDQHGDIARILSSLVETNEYAGTYLYYDTNVYNFSKDRRTLLSTVEDGVTIENGGVYAAHAVTTYTATSNRFDRVTDSIITGPDQQPRETITTSTETYSADFQRSLTELRNTSGDLISWSSYAWTNDAAHLQQFTVSEGGSNDESSPEYIDIVTNTFDSLGNLIVTTSYGESFGYVSSSLTSNSYTMGENGKILSSVSQTDYGIDGTIDMTIVTTFAYDKAGNNTQQVAKLFSLDNVFLGENVSTFGYDQFGNLLSQDLSWLDLAGNVANETIINDSYVPRGQAFERPAALQRFLDSKSANPRLH